MLYWSRILRIIRRKYWPDLLPLLPPCPLSELCDITHDTSLFLIDLCVHTNSAFVEDTANKIMGVGKPAPPAAAPPAPTAAGAAATPPAADATPAAPAVIADAQPAAPAAVAAAVPAPAAP